MGLLHHPDIGTFWVPARSISLPKAPAHPVPSNVVVATVRRPLWSSKGLLTLPSVTHPKPDSITCVRELLRPFLKELDPRLFLSEVVWASITRNGRVDFGGGHNVSRIFGTVGAALGVGIYLGIASADITITTTDRSLGSITVAVTTNEFTTIGLSRATATVQNYVAATSLNGTYSTDLYKSFSVTGTGTAYGGGLFDSATTTTNPTTPNATPRRLGISAATATAA